MAENESGMGLKAIASFFHHLFTSFPSRFVIGRSRGEAGAERRREELNGYIWHLVHAAPEVAEVGGPQSLPGLAPLRGGECGPRRACVFWACPGMGEGSGSWHQPH